MCACCAPVHGPLGESDRVQGRGRMRWEIAEGREGEKERERRHVYENGAETICRALLGTCVPVCVFVCRRVISLSHYNVCLLLQLLHNLPILSLSLFLLAWLHCKGTLCSLWAFYSSVEASLLWWFCFISGRVLRVILYFCEDVITLALVIKLFCGQPTSLLTDSEICPEIEIDSLGKICEKLLHIVWEGGAVTNGMSVYLKELKNLKQIKKQEDRSKTNVIFCKVMHLN